MGKIICIDAGHGGSDPGASGNGVIEKNVTLNGALKLGEALKKQGFDVIFTRVSDNYISLGERCGIANSKGADLFISIHVNSAPSEAASGTEVLCYKKNYFAELLQKNLIKKLGTKDRGVKERKDLAVLNGTKMNAVLIEIAFLSNKEDAKLLKSEIFIEKCAYAVTKAVCEYFKVPFKDNSEEGGTEMDAHKKIDVVIDGKKETTDGYFIDDRNLFTADFLRRLGFKVGYDEKSKAVIIDNGDVKDIDVIADGKPEKVASVFRDGFNFVSLRELERVGAIDVDYKDGLVYIEKK